MKTMEITQIPSKQLKALAGLAEKREQLSGELDQINSRLTAYSDGRKTYKPTARGEMKTNILALLKKAGKRGMHVNEIAEKMSSSPNSIGVWFYTTGKKMKNIKKVGPAWFALS